MQLTTLSKKNKVCLSDYNYLRDIENRLLMSQFSVFDVTVLSEILSDSIQIPIKRLAKALNVCETDIASSIEKFQTAKLLANYNGILVVDKEMRKYYESQILKYDEDFQPNIDFLKGLLRKVPIDVLPVWYSISRTSNDIFASIIEKYLYTPKIYNRYLNEQSFDDPVLAGIMSQVFQAPGFKVKGRELKERFNLTPQEFEEALLHLEYHFICCLSYEKNEERWEEVVTPFYEWGQYLKFLKEAPPSPLPEKEVALLHNGPFGFVNNLALFLQKLETYPVVLDTTQLCFYFDPQQMNAFNIEYNPKVDVRSHYMRHLIGRALTLNLCHLKEDSILQLSPVAKHWLALSEKERALSLYRLDLTHLESFEIAPPLLADRNLRDIERCLLRVAAQGFILLEDFINCMLAPLHPRNEVALKKQGRRWLYHVPQYDEAEKEFIRGLICERFMESDLVHIGTHRGRLCFKLTDYGKSLLA